MAKNKISVNRAAVTLALVFGIFQAVWGAVLAATNGGILEHCYKWYLMSAPPAYTGFDATAYVLGVGDAFFAGLIFGALAAFIWNRMKG